MMLTTRPTVNFLRTFILLFSLLAIAQAHPHPSKTYTTTVTVTETETTTAVSTPTGSSGSGNQSGQCNTGPIQCCQIVEPASGGLANLLLGLLGIILGDLDVDVGINCSPLSIIGIGGTNCNASPVCCENNNFNGLISIGCIPIIIEL